MVKCPKCNENIPYMTIRSRYGKLTTCNGCESKLKIGKQPIFISVIFIVIFNVILFFTDIIDEFALQMVFFLVLFFGSIIIGIKWMKLELVKNPQLYNYQTDLRDYTERLIGISVLLLLLGVFVYMCFFVMEDDFWRNVGIGASFLLAVLIVTMIYWIFKRKKLKKLIEKDKEEIRIQKLLKG